MGNIHQRCVRQIPEDPSETRSLAGRERRGRLCVKGQFWGILKCAPVLARFRQDALCSRLDGWKADLRRVIQAWWHSWAIAGSPGSESYTNQFARVVDLMALPRCIVFLLAGFPSFSYCLKWVHDSLIRHTSLHCRFSRIPVMIESLCGAIYSLGRCIELWQHGYRDGDERKRGSCWARRGAWILDDLLTGRSIAAESFKNLNAALCLVWPHSMYKQAGAGHPDTVCMGIPYPFSLKYLSQRRCTAFSDPQLRLTAGERHVGGP